LLPKRFRDRALRSKANYGLELGRTISLREEDPEQAGNGFAYAAVV
jgi:hypothetical protein